LVDRDDPRLPKAREEDGEGPRPQDLIALYEKDLKSSLRLLQRLDQLSAEGGIKLPWFDMGVNATNELYIMLKEDNNRSVGCYDTVLGVYAARYNTKTANERQWNAYLLELKKMAVEAGILAIVRARPKHL